MIGDDVALESSLAGRDVGRRGLAGAVLLLKVNFFPTCKNLSPEFIFSELVAYRWQVRWLKKVQILKQLQKHPELLMIIWVTSKQF